MHHHARALEPSDDPGGDIAGALRGPARQQDHVVLERGGEPSGERDLVIGDDALRIGKPPCSSTAAARIAPFESNTPPERIGWPGGISSSPVEKIATRGLRHTSISARPIAASEPIPREVSTWPARSTVSPREMSLPARRRAPGSDRPVHLDQDLARGILRLGVLDHHDRVGASGQHPAGRDHGCRARNDGVARRHAGGQHLRVEAERPGAQRGSADGVGRAHREPVHAGSVEPGDVDQGDDVAREDAPERVPQRDALGSERRHLQELSEPRLGLVPVHHLQELSLPRCREQVRLRALFIHRHDSRASCRARGSRTGAPRRVRRAHGPPAEPEPRRSRRRARPRRGRRPRPSRSA